MFFPSPLCCSPEGIVCFCFSDAPLFKTPNLAVQICSGLHKDAVPPRFLALSPCQKPASKACGRDAFLGALWRHHKLPDNGTGQALSIRVLQTMLWRHLGGKVLLDVIGVDDLFACMYTFHRFFFPWLSAISNFPLVSTNCLPRS